MREVMLKSAPGRLTAYICCEIDHHTAKVIREATDARLSEERPAELVLDFSGVPFMDSSGIGLILGRLDKAGELGGTVILSGLSEPLMRLIRLSGILRMRNLSVEG